MTRRALVWLLISSFTLAIAMMTSEPVAAADGGKVLRHVVLFKFKDSASKDDVQKVIDAFAALPKKIDVIKDFEWGTDVSVENKSEGFTHCFFVTFADAKGRDTYLPHPAHQEFVGIVRPVLDKVLVFDYVAHE